jgi:murein DD-endopeptidase MepM/ murein hydrolase activator NlpD
MRLHPILNVYKLHDGTDFGVGCGTPVLAAAAGEVVSAYGSEGYGNQLVLNHGTVNGQGLATSYSHLTSFSASPGDSVQQGDIIGYSGNTGYSTGCHLHFMVYENGTPVNPMGWI